MRRRMPEPYARREAALPVRVALVLLLAIWMAQPARASAVDAAPCADAVAHAGMAFIATATTPAGAPGVIMLAQAAVEPAARLVAANGTKTEPLAVEAAPQTPQGKGTAEPVAEQARTPEKPVAVPAKSSIRLFNTLEFRGVLKNMPKWQRVVEAEKKSRTFDRDLSKLMRGSIYKQWLQLVERTQSASVLEKARAITVFFNRWPYRTDQDVYKLPDYWATPAEFLQKSGDCEDYAITKFYALIKLGVPPESMRVVALKDSIRNLAHAVLVVYVNNDAYVLDNMTDMVLTHSRYQHYWPQYSVNEIYRWAHVRPKKAKK